MAIEIRPYEPDDLPHVLSIWGVAIRQSCPFLTEDFLVGERKDIAETFMPTCECWLASDPPDQPAGFIALLGGEVGGLFVHPGAQRRGFGRALLDKALALRGRLELDVFEKNQIGRRFYDAYGFTLKNRRIHEPTGEVELRLAFDPRVSKKREISDKT